MQDDPRLRRSPDPLQLAIVKVDAENDSSVLNCGRLNTGLRWFDTFSDDWCHGGAMHCWAKSDE